MRLYISVDLEGIHGVDRYDDPKHGVAEYRRWKRRVGHLMAGEIKALFLGMVQNSVKEAFVFDCHSGNDLTGVSEITGFGQRNAAKSMQIMAYLP